MGGACVYRDSRMRLWKEFVQRGVCEEPREERQEEKDGGEKKRYHRAYKPEGVVAPSYQPAQLALQGHYQSTRSSPDAFLLEPTYLPTYLPTYRQKNKASGMARP